MPHTVYIDAGDHYNVLMDVSGSKRHAALTEVAWQNEYATSPNYQAMRNSQVGSVAGVTPKGCGKWLKDWNAPFVGQP